MKKIGGVRSPGSPAFRMYDDMFYIYIIFVFLFVSFVLHELYLYLYLYYICIVVCELALSSCPLSFFALLCSVTFYPASAHSNLNLAFLPNLFSPFCTRFFGNLFQPFCTQRHILLSHHYTARSPIEEHTCHVMLRKYSKRPKRSTLVRSTG